MREFDVKRFYIRGDTVKMFASETEYGPMTVAEINNGFHHLGAQPCSIATAIFFYEKLKGIVLSTKELEMTFHKNSDQFGK